jgi:hypothetical protein
MWGREEIWRAIRERLRRLSQFTARAKINDGENKSCEHYDPDEVALSLR